MKYLDKSMYLNCIGLRYIFIKIVNILIIVYVAF